MSLSKIRIMDPHYKMASSSLFHFLHGTIICAAFANKIIILPNSTIFKSKSLHLVNYTSSLTLYLPLEPHMFVLGCFYRCISGYSLLPSINLYIF